MAKYKTYVTMEYDEDDGSKGFERFSKDVSSDDKYNALVYTFGDFVKYISKEFTITDISNVDINKDLEIASFTVDAEGDRGQVMVKITVGSGIEYN